MTTILTNNDKPAFYVGKNVPVFLSKLCPVDNAYLHKDVTVGKNKYKRLIIAYDKKLGNKDFKLLSDLSCLL